jgi:2-oxoglutarate dehydrogenase E2 component (dihydrolipoamide succinyltransferase)
MHDIKKRPMVIDDQIVIRPVMYVALSYDHRVIDGKQAIGFLMTVKKYIEEPDKLLLEL